MFFLSLTIVQILLYLFILYITGKVWIVVTVEPRLSRLVGTSVKSPDNRKYEY